MDSFAERVSECLKRELKGKIDEKVLEMVFERWAKEFYKISDEMLAINGDTEKKGLYAEQKKRVREDSANVHSTELNSDDDMTEDEEAEENTFALCVCSKRPKRSKTQWKINAQNGAIWFPEKGETLFHSMNATLQMG